MILFFLIGMTSLYGYTHFGAVEWLSVWFHHFWACFTATVVFCSVFVIGQQIYQHILSIPIKKDNKLLDITGNSTKFSNWDIALFLGLGCVGLWNALCFWISVPILGYTPIIVSLFLFYKDMGLSISYFKYSFMCW